MFTSFSRKTSYFGHWRLEAIQCGSEKRKRTGMIAIPVPSSDW
jgi:hypothetical protein